MSISVTANMVDSSQIFGSDFNRRIREFDRQLKAAAAAGAQAAQAGTRKRVTYLRPPTPQRPGRKTTQGNMASHLKWKVVADYEVMFDVQHANSKVPYWFIQEIGTGQAATIRYGNDSGTGTRGRPRAGESTRRTVPSQIGRAIPSSLAFGTGPRGKFTDFGAATGQGLYLRKNLKGAPSFRGKSRAPMVTISKEIKGKHFVRDGAKEGFRQYRSQMLAAAKSTLRKPKTFP